MRTRTHCQQLPRVFVFVLALLPTLGGCGEPDAPELAATRPTYDAEGGALFDVERPDVLPNLIVLVIDALRQDALPLDEEVAAAARMPHLASLAREGVAFSNAVAPAPWTLPSITSLLTGLQPSAHGLSAPESRVRLVDAITTWAEVLHTTYGYETVAHTAGPWFTGSATSVLQGFEHTEGEFSLRETERRLRRWARTRDRRRPFFLFLHTYDAHDPYGEQNRPWRGVLPDVANDPTLVGPNADPAEIFRRTYQDAGVGHALRDVLGRQKLVTTLHRYGHTGYAADPRPDLAAELATAYWDGVRWTDELLAHSMRLLEAQGLLRNTLLVVTSDHGEGFGEHDSLIHGRYLYDELVHIPLVMVGPAPFRGGQVLSSSVGLVDVIPTFFDWAGLEPISNVEGRSMLDLFTVDGGCRAVLSEERLGFLNTGQPCDALRLSARTEHWKYILTYDLETGEAREELYDLLLDPDEVDDLTDGTGRVPPELVFDDCFCEAVESIRRRIWDRIDSGPEDASHIPYGVSNRPPSAPPPVPCKGGTG